MSRGGRRSGSRGSLSVSFALGGCSTPGHKSRVNHSSRGEGRGLCATPPRAFCSITPSNDRKKDPLLKFIRSSQPRDAQDRNGFPTRTIAER
ncbi:hypothetical protein EYF80_021223 [Liparis tanakae]|uniref:Uncharacterized protein n=1 Tax=Liparis tanakae TaxID=230148 RepID=A0A4Z2HS91_9TELE|nr:hypothetical protein EYF80_021223 [Liparis tanakae]